MTITDRIARIAQTIADLQAQLKQLEALRDKVQQHKEQSR